MFHRHATIPGVSLQVCAIHPTEPDDETCNYFDYDPETEAILYENFLSIGEAEVNDTLIIPSIQTQRRTGHRRGRGLLMESWCRVED